MKVAATGLPMRVEAGIGLLERVAGINLPERVAGTGQPVREVGISLLERVAGTPPAPVRSMESKSWPSC